MRYRSIVVYCTILVLCCGACQAEGAPEELNAVELLNPTAASIETTSLPATSPTVTAPPPTAQVVESPLAVSAYHTELLSAAADVRDEPLFGYISGDMSDVLILQRADGTVYQEFQLGPYLVPRSINSVGFVDPADISANGEWVVVRHIASFFVEDAYEDSKLSLINMWTGEVRTLPLFREDFPAGVDEAKKREAVTAIEQMLPQWSPDGRYLAYAAVLDGPSSDLYVYDVVADESMRLSFGPNQLTLIPGWSPDGDWIVHEEWLDVYTEDGSYDERETIRVWAASLDGRLVELFDPFDPVTGGGHAYPAWIGLHDLVVYDYLYDMGFRAVRIDVSTGRTIPFLPQFGMADEQGMFYTLDVEPESGLAAFGAYPQFSETSLNLEPGFYLQEVGEEPIRVLEDDPLRPEWLEILGMFYVQGSSSAYLVDPDGTILSLEENTYADPLPSPDGRWLLMYGERGIQVFDVTNGALVFWIWEEEARWALWEPGSGGFVFGTGWPEDGLVWRVGLEEPVIAEAVEVPAGAQTTWPVVLLWEGGIDESRSQ